MSNTTADAFLKSEIEQIEKSTKRTWYFGCVIIVILIAYLSFILFMTRTFLEPQNAAYLVSSNIKENLPQFINQTESMLVQKAPRTANQASHLFMGAIPQLREMAEEQIRITHEEMIPHLSRELQDMTRAYIADNAETLRSFSAEEGGPQLAEHVTAELMESMGAHMQTEFAEEWHGRNLVYIRGCPS